MNYAPRVECFLFFIILIAINSSVSCINIRGGWVPQASDPETYFEQFKLDYGDSVGFRTPTSAKDTDISNKFKKNREKDIFLKWLNEYFVLGPQSESGRLKPFHIADFGSRKDLKNGENPKIIIVQRKLAADIHGNLLPPRSDIDVEVRDIWQPWLKYKCDFVVRYVVPDRINILKILESKKLFHAEISEDTKNKNKIYSKLTFKAPLLQRILGKPSVTMKVPLNDVTRNDMNALFTRKKHS